MKISAWLPQLLHQFRRDEFTSDLQDEMRLHVELRARRLREQGVHPDEAAYAALRQFGNRSAGQDARSEQWGFAAPHRLMRDFCQGYRASSGFTGLAVPTLAVGAGIHTAVFSIVSRRL